MSECTNLEMRDLLPDFARGALAGPARVAVEEHLASCAACRDELALVRSARAVLSATPPVEASRIAAAVIQSRVARRHTTRRVWLAAASVVAILGAALLATTVARGPVAPYLPPVVVEGPTRVAPAPRGPTEPVRSTTRPVAGPELVVGGGLSDLADADLESLLRIVDGLDAQLDVEPAALLPLLEGEV
jgi:anti-sigma factor RsiW